MDTDRADDLTGPLIGADNRRSLVAKTLLGAGVALLPSVLLSNNAAAFRSLSGCEKKCNHRFSGKCQTRCCRCCKKIFEGGRTRCSFGCGSIRRK